MINMSDRAIRALPYEKRLEYYHKDKDELFMKLSKLPAAEVQKAHEELIKKWRI